jgi:E3 ubiquitin-protein ligase DOA10
MVWPAALVGVGWLIALATGVKRLYAYATLAVIAFVMGYWFNLNFPLLFTVLGAVIVLSGIAVLVRFQRKYPVPKGKQPE